MITNSNDNTVDTMINYGNDNTVDTMITMVTTIQLIQ